MALTYDLLLALYRGRATAVEQIPPEDLQFLAVPTPLTALIEDAGQTGAPRHVVLTGSAGDGKTFAATCAQTAAFSAITDASAETVAALANRVSEDLRSGKRLLIAINRGQLERLYLASRAAGGPLSQFVEAVRDRTLLREAWAAAPADIAVADLGHLDRSEVVTEIAKKCASVPTPPNASHATRVAFETAKHQLQHPRVLEWLTAVVAAATSSGANVSMRQLWQFVAYAATGARAIEDTRPASLSDSVGARLFSSEAQGPLFDAARERLDPATTPDAAFSRRVVCGAAWTDLRGSDLRPLTDTHCRDGALITRVAAVHQIGLDRRPALPNSLFAETCSGLLAKGGGWHAHPAVVGALLEGAYRAVGLWHSAEVFPAWQSLCYDISKFEASSVVATSNLDPHQLRLAVPRPPPEVEAHVLRGWRPPFLWLGASDRPHLRVTPRVFDALIAKNLGALEQHDLFGLERWLAMEGACTPPQANAEGLAPLLRVARRRRDACVVLKDSMKPGKSELSVEGVNAGGLHG